VYSNGGRYSEYESIVGGGRLVDGWYDGSRCGGCEGGGGGGRL